MSDQPMEEFVDGWQPFGKGTEKRRLRMKKRAEYKVRTSSMWTGIYVFATLIGALVAFAYFTVLKQNITWVWGIIGLIAVAILYAGWTFVASDEGGAQLAGQLLGY